MPRVWELSIFLFILTAETWLQNKIIQAKSSAIGSFVLALKCVKEVFVQV